MSGMISRFLPALAFLVAVSQTLPAAKPAASKSNVSSAHARASDAEIDRAMRAKFAKSKISVDKFTTHVQGGVVTIEGKTDIIQHKGVATRMAKNSGAVAVVNNVKISDAARAKAAGNLAKMRQRAHIKPVTGAGA